MGCNTLALFYPQRYCNPLQSRIHDVQSKKHRWWTLSFNEQTLLISGTGYIYIYIFIYLYMYPVVVNSWVHFAYAAHMRHMTYAAYDICGAHMRDICGICRLGLNKPSRKSMVFQMKRKIVCESRCQDRRNKRICGDICGAYAAYVICPHCC